MKPQTFHRLPETGSQAWFRDERASIRKRGVQAVDCLGDRKRAQGARFGREDQQVFYGNERRAAPPGGRACHRVPRFGPGAKLWNERTIRRLCGVQPVVLRAGRLTPVEKPRWVFMTVIRPFCPNSLSRAGRGLLPCPLRLHPCASSLAPCASAGGLQAAKARRPEGTPGAPRALYSVLPAPQRHGRHRRPGHGRQDPHGLEARRELGVDLDVQV